MPDKSTVNVQIETGTADGNGVLMMLDDRLVAILIELTDPVHGSACGRWSLETMFGTDDERAPETFASIEQAWHWIGRTQGGERWKIV